METYIGYAIATYFIIAVGVTATTPKNLVQALRWPVDLFNRLKG